MISVVYLILLALPSPTQPSECTDDYYAIDLIPTRRVPAARQAEGSVRLTFVPSPFGVAVDPNGSYRYNLDVQVNRLGPVPGHEYTVWLSTPNLKEVVRLGPLSREGHIAGSVSWNKFLVIITLEPEGSAPVRWTGPVVMRGLSRSGLMHTMAGHGPFEQEPCTVYGYY